ncbi:MAG: flagellar P-ring protein precursor FlgI [Hyphomicrobiaceae bacterium]|jgi:flagellar P-ring protein precursor FlgI
MCFTTNLLTRSLSVALLSAVIATQSPIGQTPPAAPGGAATTGAASNGAASGSAATSRINGSQLPPAGASASRSLQRTAGPFIVQDLTTAATSQQDPIAPVRTNRLGQTVLSPRISSITRVANSMPHQLTGIGLVTGLIQGNGSNDRGTRQALINYIKRHDLNLDITDVTNGSTALVALTCNLPPFAKQGMELDVKVEVVGDALSLRGGQLMRAALKGVDGKEYISAQGAIIVAGFSVKGKNADVNKNPSATGHLLNGGLVIREEHTSFFSESGALELRLLNPSPYNSSSVAAGIKTALAGTNILVSPVDPSLVRLELPDEQRTNEYAMKVLGLIGNVRVAVENPTKVTIDQVSGTVLAGEGVMISPCVVGLSELTISIVEEDFVSQPNPLAQGTTERVGRSRIETDETSTELQPIGGGGATVSDLLQNLKALGLTPAQLVSVFTALDQGGFLHATLEIH